MNATLMLEQAEMTRSAVGLASDNAALAAYNVVQALARGAEVDAHLRELSVRTAELVDAATGLERELATILDAATAEDQRRATSGLTSHRSVWLAGSGSGAPPDDVADQLHGRLVGLADQAVPLASAASEVICGLPGEYRDLGVLPRGRRRPRRTSRPRSSTHRGA